MKRWTIHAPSSSQYEEDPVGEWVEFDDVKAKLDRLAQAEALLNECLHALAMNGLGTTRLARDMNDFLLKRVNRSASP